MDIKKTQEETKIAVVLALPREVASAQIVFADYDQLEYLGVQFGFSCYCCQVPSDLSGSDDHSVVLALPHNTGNNNSAICVAQLVNHFENLEYLILCGIAGGAPSIGDEERDVHLGDIVVANQDGIFQHDFGKDIYPPSIKFLLDKPRNPYVPSEVFDNINNSLTTEKDLGNLPWVDRLNERLPILIGKNSNFRRPKESTTQYLYDETDNGLVNKIPRNPPYDSPQVFRGGIASGNCVLKNPFRRDNLREHHKILAVEMEAAGFSAACKQFNMNFTVVRGICDYCDSNKNDDWQYYAAASAAAYTYCIVSRIPSKPLRTQTVDGSMETDLSSLERIGMQSAEPGMASASSQTGVEFSEPVIISPKQKTQLESDIQQMLIDMENASAIHDWDSRYKIAQSLEVLILSSPSEINESIQARGLYEIAQAYIHYSNIKKDGDDLKKHAHQLITKAQGIIG